MTACMGFQLFPHRNSILIIFWQFGAYDAGISLLSGEHFKRYNGDRVTDILWISSFHIRECLLCSVTKSGKLNSPVPLFVPRSLHSARVVFQVILMEGRRKEAGVRDQSWELSMEQGEPEVEARAVTRTIRANMSAMVIKLVTK